MDALIQTLVIPAQAGIQDGHSESRGPRTPAFAGVTTVSISALAPQSR
jgi:hypothetical protein